MVVLIALFRT